VSFLQVVHVCAEHKKPAKLLKHLGAIKAAAAGLRNPPRVLVFANKIKVRSTTRFENRHLLIAEQQSVLCHMPALVWIRLRHTPTEAGSVGVLRWVLMHLHLPSSASSTTPGYAARAPKRVCRLVAESKECWYLLLLASTCFVFTEGAVHRSRGMHILILC
jgi:hypothetical protein